MLLTPKALTDIEAEGRREALSGETDKDEEAEDNVKKSNTFESTTWDVGTSTGEAEGWSKLLSVVKELASSTKFDESRGWW